MVLRVFKECVGSLRDLPRPDARLRPETVANTARGPMLYEV